METYYTHAMERWLRTNPGMKVTQFQVSELLSEAYGKAACIQTAVNGFKAAGVWPIDRDVLQQQITFVKKINQWRMQKSMVMGAKKIEKTIHLKP
ncbi:hypothetical protein QE152_g11030 [Popillia japonica]|uniref:Uncharacterized protein n=1 Tax=Popillia japonica TaxID=7064 RepID=A0AAW1LRS0_POPJA